MPRMKLEDRASKKVERAGEPNALCQHATKRAHGSSCSVKSIISGGVGGLGWGGNLQKPEVGICGFGSLEEGGSGLWGVIEEARCVSKHAPALRPD